MNLFKLVPLIGAVCNLLVTLFVSTRGLRSTVNRVYLLWGISLTIWNLGTYALFVVDNASAALFWARFLQFGVIFTPVTLFHLSLLIAQIPVGRYMKALYGLQIALALSNLTPFFIRDVRFNGYAYYSIAGPGFRIFSLTLGLTVASVFILSHKRRRLATLHKTRLSALIVAQSGLVIFGINDVLPILGFDYYEELLPFLGIRAKAPSHLQIYPFGSMAAIFYGVIVGYSVLQHQLLNIRVTLGKIAANLVRVGFLVAVGLLLLFLAAFFGPRDQFTTYSFFVSLGVLLCSAVIAATYFPRLFGKGDDRLERRLLGDRFEYHDKVRSFIQSINVYTDARLLIDDLHDLLVNTIQVRSYQIILLDETTRQFSLLRAYPEPSLTFSPGVSADSPLFQYFKITGSDFLAYNEVYALPGENVLERSARGQLREYNPEFCFPLVFDEEILGFMLVGAKVSGDLYTQLDLRFLTDMVKNLGLFMNQIRLKKQVAVAEELELLGRMSRGMAHDLNNLLTPVSTLLQLMRDDLLDRGKSEELLPVALRNVVTMHSYIKEALFFSQNHTPRLEPGRLDQVIQKAVATAEPALRRKEMEVAVRGPEDVVVEMDSVLIQRLVANILSNAIDASPPKSTIKIELQRLIRTEANRDWLRIRVIDEGEGIKREHLRRIFKPYFTTKDRGDETRGFGLGLAICRQIVHLHQGNLNIASEEKKGTTVQVDLPSRQINRPAQAVALNLS
jgi:signal transduction histidine kinase